MQRRLRIGTRGSPLALVQANDIASHLHKMQQKSVAPPEIITFSTLGDRVQQGRPGSFGGKGVFTREPEEALRQGLIDVVVHSLKDMAAEDPHDLLLAAVPAREDARDLWFCTQNWTHPRDIATGSVIGTASLRRRAQILHAQPQAQVIILRGNIQTRLNKMHQGVCVGTLLAAAGLRRMGMSGGTPLSLEEWTPAAGQAALGVQIHANADRALHNMVQNINHQATAAAVTVERAFLRGLGASCRMPVSAHARVIDDSTVHFMGHIYTLNGTMRHSSVWTHPLAQAADYAFTQGQYLLQYADDSFYDLTPENTP